MKQLIKTMRNPSVVAFSKLFPAQFTKEYFGRICLNFAKELLNSHGFDVRVIRPIPYVPALVAHFSRTLVPYIEHSSKQMTQGIQVEYPRYLRFPYSHDWFEATFLERVARDLLQGGGSPDIIYSHWPYPEGVACMRLADSLSMKSVLHFHAGGLQPFFQSRRIEESVRTVLRKTDLTVFVSEGIRKLVLENFDVKRHIVINNGIDESLFRLQDKGQLREKLKLEAGQIVVLAVAYLKPIKGLDDLIRAFALMVRSWSGSKKLSLIIIGEGPMGRLLQILARSLGIEQNVVFMGSQSSEVVADYMAASDLFALPSRVESFGQVFVEAAMCGCPSIGSRVGGIPEIVKPGVNGQLWVPGVPESLSVLMMESLKRNWNPERIRESVGSFTLRAAGTKLANAMIELVRS